MKKPATGSETKVQETSADKVASARRSAYMREKGVKADELQLSFVFPIIDREDLRHMPNDYARSSLFTACSRKTPRKTFLRETLFHYNEHVSIRYTGVELRAEDDELVWMQIMHFAKQIPFGKPFEFALIDVMKELGWARNGRNYERVRECISRLKANEILVSNSKAYGISASMSLIQNYEAVNDIDGVATVYRVWIDPSLMLLFAGHTFTSHEWDIYRKLTAIARRLADCMGSHKAPYPLAISKFQGICGSRNVNIRSFRQSVQKACEELQASGFAQRASLADTSIVCIR